MNYYQKALLYAYPKIDKIISHIDNVVMKKALASFSNHTSCLLQSEAIIEYSNKKQKMLYLKRKLEEIFASMKKEDMLLIEYKYFKKRNEETEKLDTVSRRYFRKQIRILEDFSKKLLANNMTYSWFEENYYVYSFFKGLVKIISEKEEV